MFRFFEKKTILDANKRQDLSLEMGINSRKSRSIHSFCRPKFARPFQRLSVPFLYSFQEMSAWTHMAHVNCAGKSRLVKLKMQGGKWQLLSWIMHAFRQ